MTMHATQGVAPLGSLPKLQFGAFPEATSFPAAMSPFSAPADPMLSPPLCPPQPPHPSHAAPGHETHSDPASLKRKLFDEDPGPSSDTLLGSDFFRDPTRAGQGVCLPLPAPTLPTLPMHQEELPVQQRYLSPLDAMFEAELGSPPRRSPARPTPAPPSPRRRAYSVPSPLRTPGRAGLPAALLSASQSLDELPMAQLMQPVMRPAKKKRVLEYRLPQPLSLTRHAVVAASPSCSPPDSGVGLDDLLYGDLWADDFFAPLPVVDSQDVLFVARPLQRGDSSMMHYNRRHYHHKHSNALSWDIELGVDCASADEQLADSLKHKLSSSFGNFTGLLCDPNTDGSYTFHVGDCIKIRKEKGGSNRVRLYKEKKHLHVHAVFYALVRDEAFRYWDDDEWHRLLKNSESCCGYRESREEYLCVNPFHFDLT